jgi:CO dehydrogenase maturation factor
MNTIAFTGKGGVGKTTIAALSLQWLVAHGRTPALAIDADSNANLHELLGITVHATVGGIREEARSIVKGDPALSKQEHLAMQIQKALVEEKGFDFLVMGRPEGPGCYCYANNVLRDCIERLSASYRSIIIDCEAGMEHISRRTLLSLDWLITVSDQSLRGLRTAVRIGELVDEMKTRVRKRALIINRARGSGSEISPEQAGVISSGEFDRVMMIPDDSAVSAMDATGGKVRDIPAHSPIVKAIDGMMSRLMEEA